MDVWVGSSNGSPAGAEGRLGPALTRDVEIRNVDASETGEDGIKVKAEGNVTITDCTTNANNGAGILVYETGGDVAITGCTSNENRGPVASVEGAAICWASGICAVDVGGQVVIRNGTANGNSGEGIYVWLLGSEKVGLGSVTTPDKVTITDSTTNGNGADGVFVGGLLFGDEVGAGLVIDGGDVIIQNCTANLRHWATEWFRV
jgi:hypothetical protein